MITIRKPYTKEYQGTTRLCADILLGDVNKTFYFEVAKEYEPYLCTEVSDAFLVGILNYAMFNGEDIKVEGAVSERLLYQIKTYFLVTLPVVRPRAYKRINVEAEPYIGKINTEGAVGTSASGGVDSYYSISVHTKDVPQDYRLTHLLIANQFNHYVSEEDTRKKFEDLLSRSQPIAENYGLKLVGVYTNHNDFLFDGFVQEYSLRICSYVLALQKLFGVYYVSSGVPFGEFDFASHDSDGFDVLNLALMSTNSLTFYSSGGEVWRTQKIKRFAYDPFIQKNLKVCNNNDDRNCCTCEKCMRTMLSLDIIGKLPEFKESFDHSAFQRGKFKYLIVVESNTIEASRDLLRSIREYDYHVPTMTILIGRTLYRLGCYIKSKIKKIHFLREIYFKLKIDYLIYGEKQARTYRYGTKYEVR